MTKLRHRDEIRRQNEILEMPSSIVVASVVVNVKHCSAFAIPLPRRLSSDVLVVTSVLVTVTSVNEVMFSRALVILVCL